MIINSLIGLPILNYIAIFPLNWPVLIAATAGCVLQEFIYWFELRHEIAKGEIPPELKSKPYWIITISSVVIFSIGAYCYFIFSENQANLNFFTIAIFSAGFPRLFKGAVQQLGNPRDKERRVSMITQSKRTFTLKDFFMINN
ncbi:MAG: hypothetical protein V7767_07650 [Leeuwenhoekiella sp.]